MDTLKYIKQTAIQNTLWINTTGTGAALADYLEAAGIPVNRINTKHCLLIKQHLNCDQHENSQLSTVSE